MECCEMIGKSAAVLAFAVAMNSGVVSAQEEDLRSNEDVAKESSGLRGYSPVDRPKESTTRS
jgi:hypothetical protein